MIFTAFD